VRRGSAQPGHTRTDRLREQHPTAGGDDERFANVGFQERQEDRVASGHVRDRTAQVVERVIRVIAAPYDDPLVAQDGHHVGGARTPNRCGDHALLRQE
jgi:hypothetical protein